MFQGIDYQHINSLKNVRVDITLQKQPSWRDFKGFKLVLLSCPHFMSVYYFILNSNFYLTLF